MRVLVCGGREYFDRGTVTQYLGALGIDLLIQGGARGADGLAKGWAERTGGVQAICGTLLCSHWPPNVCVAFPGGTGTASMVRMCKGADIAVIEVPL